MGRGRSLTVSLRVVDEVPERVVDVGVEKVVVGILSAQLINQGFEAHVEAKKRCIDPLQALSVLAVV